MRYQLLLLLLLLNACKTTSVIVAPTPTISPEPSVTATPSASPAQDLFVTYDPKSGIEQSFAQPAIDLMNKCYQSGKLKQLWLTHKFVSFNTVFDESPKTNEEAYAEYVKNKPYALNVNWYYTRSSIVGYTYNYYGDLDASWASGKTETRIWSNWNAVSGWGPADVAAHWAHELSHQVRAGGFVHYTIFDGSTPYEAGDIMEECLQ